MKVLINYFWPCLLLLGFSACNGGENGGPEKTPEEQAIERLSGPSGKPDLDGKQWWFGHQRRNTSDSRICRF